MDRIETKARRALFKPNQAEIDRFRHIAGLPCSERDAIRAGVTELTARCGIAYGLLALYRQQVQCGFVLADPSVPEGKEHKVFHDDMCGVDFRLWWNPDRELRKDHSLLIERGVIARTVDESKLINRDEEGKPCYLCSDNIAMQNPSEILFPVDLAGEQYYLGANFAYIDNNHFVLMSVEHRPQQYSKHVLEVLLDFVQQTNGYFRGTFNGLAGVSIPEHEHFQVTTAVFPVEGITVESRDVLFCAAGVRVARPFYYTPVWIVEGDRRQVTDAADRIIRAWEELAPSYHTENIIASADGTTCRLFIFLRDVRRLAGAGKFGDMASFECGGSVVLSYEPPPERSHETNERATFDSASVGTVRRLLVDIAPVVPDMCFE
jgi:hypothetical protein